MKNSYRLVLAVALAAILILPLSRDQARATEDAVRQTNPGFVPNTGQINPGTARDRPATVIAIE
jgi:hypothetical protein